MWVMLLLAWLPWVLLGGATLFLGFRAVRAFERRGVASAELTALRERFQLLEDTVAEQGEAIRRVSDGQEFTQRLLLERAGAEGKAATIPPPSQGGGTADGG